MQVFSPTASLVPVSELFIKEDKIEQEFTNKERASKDGVDRKQARSPMRVIKSQPRLLLPIPLPFLAITPAIDILARRGLASVDKYLFLRLARGGHKNDNLHADVDDLQADLRHHGDTKINESKLLTFKVSACENQVERAKSSALSLPSCDQTQIQIRQVVTRKELGLLKNMTASISVFQIQQPDLIERNDETSDHFCDFAPTKKISNANGLFCDEMPIGGIDNNQFCWSPLTLSTHGGSKSEGIEVVSVAMASTVPPLLPCRRNCIIATPTTTASVSSEEFFWNFKFYDENMVHDSHEFVFGRITWRLSLGLNNDLLVNSLSKNMTSIKMSDKDKTNIYGDTKSDGESTISTPSYGTGSGDDSSNASPPSDGRYLALMLYLVSPRTASARTHCTFKLHTYPYTHTLGSGSGSNSSAHVHTASPSTDFVYKPGSRCNFRGCTKFILLDRLTKGGFMSSAGDVCISTVLRSRIDRNNQLLGMQSSPMEENGISF